MLKRVFCVRLNGEIVRNLNWNSKVKWLAMSFLLGVLFIFQACGGSFKVFKSHSSSLASQSPLVSKSCGLNYSPGHAMIHRLSNTEYNNTVRDLLFTSMTPADGFQSTSIGGSGFSNESTNLTVSNQTVMDFAAAAEKLANEVLASKGQATGAYNQILACPAAVNPSPACIQKTVQSFSERAFRHPITTSGPGNDLDALMKVWSGGGSVEESMHDLILAVLIDPRFVFNYSDNPAALSPGAKYALSSYEFASRLSYFLWQSMPDDTLRKAAGDGSLNNPTGLKQQIQRMLKDPKSNALADVLRREWANLSQLDTASFPDIDAVTMASIRQETQLFIQDMIQNDLSLLTLINGSHTFVNKSLAAYYGWNIPAANSDSFVRVETPQADRRGILGQAGLLIVHGGSGSYTHPVQRGRFVAASMFCDAPPPPPPGIPTINGAIEGGTMRDRLKQHTASASCIGCHKVMDTVGLGLENFDMKGRWRTNYSDSRQLPIDATGQLEGGAFFNSPSGLIESIAGQPKTKSCLVQKLMSLAVARAMSSSDDRCVASVVGTQTVNPNSRFSDVIFEIAQSLQFRLNTGENP